MDFWTHCETDLGKHSIYYLTLYFPAVIGVRWGGWDAGMGGTVMVLWVPGISVNSDPVSLVFQLKKFG